MLLGRGYYQGAVGAPVGMLAVFLLAVNRETGCAVGHLLSEWLAAAFLTAVFPVSPALLLGGWTISSRHANAGEQLE
jgi:hypothetical protein